VGKKIPQQGKFSAESFLGVSINQPQVSLTFVFARQSELPWGHVLESLSSVRLAWFEPLV